MITLNDLLDIADGDRVTVYAPATEHVNTRIDFTTQDRAVLSDVRTLYGEREVKQILQMRKGEMLMVQLGEVQRDG